MQLIPRPPQNALGRGGRKAPMRPRHLQLTRLLRLGNCIPGKEGRLVRWRAGQNSRQWSAQLHTEGGGAHTLVSALEVCWLGERPGHVPPAADQDLGDYLEWLSLCVLKY